MNSLECEADDVLLIQQQILAGWSVYWAEYKWTAA